jgi:hypothetical protein
VRQRESRGTRWCGEWHCGRDERAAVLIGDSVRQGIDTPCRHVYKQHCSTVVRSRDQHHMIREFQWAEGRVEHVRFVEKMSC